MRRALAALLLAPLLAPLLASAAPAAAEPQNLPPGALEVETGQLVEWVIADPLLGPTRVTIWLPPGYPAARTRYQTLYMHDGQNLFDRRVSGYDKVWAADRSVTRLMVAGRIAPTIIIGVWHPGAARYRQYVPLGPLRLLGSEARAAVAARSDGPILSDAYLAFLVKTLKPRVDRAFRTRPDRAHTAVAGSSMGGLISLAAITDYPGVFGRAACVSTHLPLFGPDGDRPPPFAADVQAMWAAYAARRIGPPAGRRIWFDHGTATLDQYYGPYQAGLDAGLVKAGWRADTDVTSRVYDGAPHEENAWAARLDEVLAWTLGDRK